MSDYSRDFDGVPLGELLVDCCYGTSQPTDASGETPVVGIAHVRDGTVRFTDLPRITLSASDRGKLLLRRGDILLTRTNSQDLVGQCGIVDDDIEAVFASYLIRLRVDTTRVEPRYLNHWLNAPPGRCQVHRLVTRAVGQANVNPTQLRRAVRVPLPPLVEQQRVVENLGVLDTAVKKTTRLAELSRQSRRALFCSLALECVEGEVRLGDLCTADRGGSLNWADVSAGGSRSCILYGELHTYYREVATRIRSRTSVISDVETSGEEVLMPSASETAEDLARATAVPHAGVQLGSDMIVLRPRAPGQYDPAYLAHYITHLCRRQVASLAQGQSVVHLYGKDALRLHVALPSFNRQRSIAQLLATAQTEVDQLEALVAAYRRQRDGLALVLFNDVKTPSET